MDKEKKRRIEWFLNFINMDFEWDPLEDKLRLFRSIDTSLDRFLPQDLSNFQTSVLDPEIAELEVMRAQGALKRIQRRLREFIEELIKKYRRTREYERDGSLMTLSEVADLKVLSQIEIDVNVKMMIKDKPELMPAKRKRGMWKVYWPDKALENSPLEIVIAPKGGDEGLLFLFMQALDGVPLMYLRQCSECDKWFLQAGKRERLFCSDQCRARKNISERRRKERESERPIRKIRFRKRSEKKSQKEAKNGNTR